MRPPKLAGKRLQEFARQCRRKQPPSISVLVIEFGISRWAVNSYRKKLKLPDAKPGRQSPLSLRDKIKILASPATLASSLARELGVSERTVRRVRETEDRRLRPRYACTECGTRALTPIHPACAERAALRAHV